MSRDTVTAYAELHCLSNFTFLRGASHPEELVERAAALGYSALAITDECSLAGAVRAHVAAARHGMPLVIGTELRLAGGPGLVLLAADRDGYANLCELITRARRAAGKGRYRLETGDLQSGMPGCLALLLPQDGTRYTDVAAQAHWLAGLFPRRCWRRGGVGVGGARRVRGGCRHWSTWAEVPVWRWWPRVTCICTSARAAPCRIR